MIWDSETLEGILPWEGELQDGKCGRARVGEMEPTLDSVPEDSGLRLSPADCRPETENDNNPFSELLCQMKECCMDVLCKMQI